MENLQNLNITTRFEFGLGGLTLVDIPLGYNGTRITCSANVTSSSGSVKAMQHSVLLLQGIIASYNVTNLQQWELNCGLVQAHS